MAIITILTISSLYRVQEISGAVLCGLIGGHDYGPCPLPAIPNARHAQSGDEGPTQHSADNSQFPNADNSQFPNADNSQFPNADNSQFPNANNPALSSGCRLVVPTVIQIVPGASNPNNLFFYCPQVLTVQGNTSVSWINNDNTVHTVTFAKLPYDSGLIIPNQIVRNLFSIPGTFSYECKIHPFMTGTIIVK